MDSFKASMLIALGLVAQMGTAAAAPAWCEAPAFKRTGGLSGVGGVDEMHQKELLRALPAIVAMTCNPDPTVDAKETSALRARWSARLDLVESDWADIAEWVALSQGDRNGLRIKAPDAKLAMSAYDPLDQYAAIAYTKYSSGDAHYMTDALDGRLSEAGRLAYIGLCLESKKPVVWAMCQADMLALDAKKLSTEIRANTMRPGYERAIVRIVMDTLRTKIAERATAIKQLQADEPGYIKLFEIADAARASYKVAPDVLAIALAMDDAATTSSNKAYAGCDDRTWPALKAAIAAIPASKFEGLKDEPGSSFLDNVAAVLINDPTAYVAAAAHVLCNASAADALVVQLAAAMHRWAGFRGPRNAALTAMVSANVQLDTRGAQIDWPSVRRFSSVRASSTSSGGGRGPVASVKKDGATITVEFVKKLRKESVCTDWKDTNRITAITSTGTIVYDYICTKRGTITVNDAPGPRSVSPRYAEGVKAGVTVSITSDVVAGVWSKVGTPPIRVLGVPVK